MRRYKMLTAAVLVAGYLIGPHEVRACEMGIGHSALAEFEACREKEEKAWKKANVITLDYGGRLVHDTRYGTYHYYPRHGGNAAIFEQEVLDREKLRCEARSRLFYVNDALNTLRELFNSCMDLQLSLQ